MLAPVRSVRARNVEPVESFLLIMKWSSLVALSVHLMDIDVAVGAAATARAVGASGIVPEPLVTEDVRVVPQADEVMTFNDRTGDVPNELTA